MKNFIHLYYKLQYQNLSKLLNNILNGFYSAQDLYLVCPAIAMLLFPIFKTAFHFSSSH